MHTVSTKTLVEAINEFCLSEGWPDDWVDQDDLFEDGFDKYWGGGDEF